MEFFNPKNLTIPFNKFFKPTSILSLIMVIAALVLYFTPGINFGIDFRGGVQAQVDFNPTANVDEGILRGLLGKDLKGLTIQATEGGDKKGFIISALSSEKNILSSKLADILNPTFDGKWQVSKVDFVGPKVGANLKKSAILSLLYTCLLIAIYMWWRFDILFAPGALACIFHDLIITVGILALTGVEFSTTVVAALLTLAGYSINDTVVVFDRVREMEQKMLGRSKAAIITGALNSCLSRTLITSFTTLMACAVLYFFGGEAIRPFAGTLFIGIIIGTYSSIFVACPLYLWLSKRAAQKAVIA